MRNVLVHAYLDIDHGITTFDVYAKTRNVRALFSIVVVAASAACASVNYKPYSGEVGVSRAAKDAMSIDVFTEKPTRSYRGTGHLDLRGGDDECKEAFRKEAAARGLDGLYDFSCFHEHTRNRYLPGGINDKGPRHCAAVGFVYEDR